jgi:hypothetical protein
MLRGVNSRGCTLESLKFDRHGKYVQLDGVMLKVELKSERRFHSADEGAMM